MDVSKTDVEALVRNPAFKVFMSDVDERVEQVGLDLRHAPSQQFVYIGKDEEPIKVKGIEHFQGEATTLEWVKVWTELVMEEINQKQFEKKETKDE